MPREKDHKKFNATVAFLEVLGDVHPGNIDFFFI